MKKFSTVLALSLMLSSFFALTAFAGAWLTAKDGWWYRYDDGSYPISQWVWIDGDNDGVSECYYFNQWGYLITDTHSPDGYYVDANGAWVDSGRVQTRGQKKNQFSIYGNYRLKNQEYRTAIANIYRDFYGNAKIELNGVNVEGTGVGEFISELHTLGDNYYIATDGSEEYLQWVKVKFNNDGTISITDSGNIGGIYFVRAGGFDGDYIRE